MQLSRNFTAEEFNCPCCGEVIINGHLVNMLQAARDRAAIAFVITSGYRCENWNRILGGAEDSSHLSGMAVDIATETLNQRFIILKAVLAAGFRRIGVYMRHIHVDIDGTKPEDLVWLA